MALSESLDFEGAIFIYAIVIGKLFSLAIARVSLTNTAVTYNDIYIAEYIRFFRQFDILSDLFH